MDDSELGIAIKWIQCELILKLWATYRFFRAEEIAVAQSIESGRNTMIHAICESPITLLEVLS